ncbi:TrbC/VirB2 family protein (plasmid) [Lactobacillus sp. ESL0731]|uniref:TrbC/VirB2 family protein n=1 Tax=unclassified Lactobacillus TaxID=2620435 RepID=UPI0023FA323F|nr:MULTISPECIES: TrbC/VirB2 family protein [unclassified Lactobacillus]WEV52098.1 TrbC/VirB2 family protein [Lactobacillus sp. ESL0700]WEV63211.1 TrbC/VirB2 family protein [Lactobacillus sp. ESL0731]
MNFLSNLLLKGQLFLAKAPSGSAVTNPIDKANTAISGVQGSLTKLGVTLSIIMLIVAGIAWFFGRAGSAFAKKIMGGCFIGAAVIALATSIVPWVMSIFA